MTNKFEEYIKKYTDSLKDCALKDAMVYALEGGKRFRPRIIFSILKGFNINEELGFDVSLALEMIQTYSLIHDDLPAMDNDDMRRGKPSLHKAFREDIAILAGDQLLTDSFGVIARANYDDSTKVNLIKDIASYAGIEGMIYGQLLDVTANSNDLDKDKLFLIQDNKTGGLFKICCLSAMHIAKNNDYDYFLQLGSKIGQIFQNQDDLFDLIKSEQETGKNKSDVKNDKATALTIYDVDSLKAIIDEEFNDLDTYLNKACFDTSYLKEVLYELKYR